MAYARDFDYPERFEREKATRIMPDALEHLGAYVLRIMMVPGSRPFAKEYGACVLENIQEGEFHNIAVAMSPIGTENGIIDFDMVFNRAGLMIFRNTDRLILPDQPEIIEMGYFVGSTDPYDLSLAELTTTAQTPELALAR